MPLEVGGALKQLALVVGDARLQPVSLGWLAGFSFGRNSGHDCIPVITILYGKQLYKCASGWGRGAGDKGHSGSARKRSRQATRWWSDAAGGTGAQLAPHPAVATAVMMVSRGIFASLWNQSNP
jgi:hypothetical protein